MRHVAQLIGAAADAAGEYLLLGSHVEQAVLDLQTTASGHDVADQHVLRADGAPVAIDHFAGLGRLADHVLPRNGLEIARIAQVVADDAGHVLGQHIAALPAERHHGDRHGAIGTAGNHQRISRLRQADECDQCEERIANQVNHRLRSSGLKIIRRCR
ncbi:hypothetical protein D9M71_475930 [compost metagenome]